MLICCLPIFRFQSPRLCPCSIKPPLRHRAVSARLCCAVSAGAVHPCCYGNICIHPSPKHHPPCAWGGPQAVPGTLRGAGAVPPLLPWKQRGCGALTVLLCAEVTGPELSPSEHLLVLPMVRETSHQSSYLQSPNSVLSSTPASPWQQSALACSSHPRFGEHPAWGDAWPRSPSPH